MFMFTIFLIHVQAESGGPESVSKYSQIVPHVGTVSHDEVFTLYTRNVAQRTHTQTGHAHTV
jgi:hypothetical protein